MKRKYLVNYITSKETFATNPTPFINHESISNISFFIDNYIGILNELFDAGLIPESKRKIIEELNNISLLLRYIKVYQPASFNDIFINEGNTFSEIENILKTIDFDKLLSSLDDMSLEHFDSYYTHIPKLSLGKSGRKIEIRDKSFYGLIELLKNIFLKDNFIEEIQKKLFVDLLLENDTIILRYYRISSNDNIWNNIAAPALEDRLNRVRARIPKDRVNLELIIPENRYFIHHGKFLSDNLCISNNGMLIGNNRNIYSFFYPKFNSKTELVIDVCNKLNSLKGKEIKISKYNEKQFDNFLDGITNLNQRHLFSNFRITHIGRQNQTCYEFFSIIPNQPVSENVTMGIEYFYGLFVNLLKFHSLVSLKRRKKNIVFPSINDIVQLRYEDKDCVTAKVGVNYVLNNIIALTSKSMAEITDDKGIIYCVDYNCLKLIEKKSKENEKYSKSSFKTSNAPNLENIDIEQMAIRWREEARQQILRGEAEHAAQAEPPVQWLDPEF